MSKHSEILTRRRIKRRIGRKRCTHHDMLSNATLRALKRIMREDGTKVMHETAFSIEVRGGSPRVREILREEGFLELGPGNFVHKKARFSDLTVSAMSFSVVSVQMLPEFKFTQLDQFTRDQHYFSLLPKVSTEEIERLGKRLRSTEAIRLDTSGGSG